MTPPQSLTYPMITHTPLLASNLPIKTVVRQQPTNTLVYIKYIHIYTCTSASKMTDFPLGIVMWVTFLLIFSFLRSLRLSRSISWLEWPILQMMQFFFTLSRCLRVITFLAPTISAENDWLFGILIILLHIVLLLGLVYNYCKIVFLTNFIKNVFKKWVCGLLADSPVADMRMSKWERISSNLTTRKPSILKGIQKREEYKT